MGKVVAAIGSTKGSARAQIDAPGLDDSFTSGDLGGTYGNPIVTGISGLPIDTLTPPGVGEVLTWDGSQWVPTPVGSGGPPSGAAGGDLGGLYPNPSVSGIQGRTISSTAPLADQTLRWNAGTNQWEPADNLPGGSAGGDLTGTYPNPEVIALRGYSVVGAVPTNGYVLTWNSANGWWEPAVTAPSPPSGAAGGDLTGTYPNPTLGLNTVDLDKLALDVLFVLPTTDEKAALAGTDGAPSGTNRYVTDSDPRNSDSRTPTGGAGGDLTGTYPNPTIAAGAVDLTNLDTGVTDLLPSSDQKDALAGTDGVPSASNPFVTDSDPRLTDSRSPSGAAGGGLTGTYPNPTIASGAVGLTQLDTPVTNVLPSTDEKDALKGTVGTPSDTNRYVTDQDPRNSDSRTPTGPAGGELTGNYPNPSIAAGAVDLTNLDTSVTDLLPSSDEKDALQGTDGTPGILNPFVTDSDPRLSDARAPTGVAGGDLSGSYPNPTVAKIYNNPVGAALPAIGQVLTWNGSAWVPAASGGGGGGGGGGLVYYLNGNVNGDSPTVNLPGTPKQLSTQIQGSGSSITSGALGVAYSVVEGFVTDDGFPNLTAIPAGLWEFNVWAEASDPTPSATSFRAEVYYYDGSNPPVFVATSTETPLIDPTNVTKYAISVVVPQTALVDTDRIFVELEAKNASGGTVTFYFGGSQPSNTSTTLPSVSGTGLIHVINGVLQSPASPVDLSAGDAEVVGTLPVTKGGTGLATPPGVGDILVGNGTDYDQKLLSGGTGISITNGVGTITVSNTGVTSVDVSGGMTGLTTSGGPVTTTGSITLDGLLNIAHGGTGLSTTPSNGQLLIGNGSDYSLNTITASTGISVTNGSGTIAIANTGVTSVDASGGLTGLTFSGGPVTTTGTVTLDGTLNIGHGGTGLTTAPSNGQLLIGGSGSYTLGTLTAGTGISVINASGVITVNNTGVTSVNVSGGTTGLTFSGGPVTTTGTITMAGTLGIANGGTGLTASGASGNILVSNGTSLASVPVSKDATLNSAGQLTVTGVQGTQFAPTAPTADQLMQYNAGTGQWTPTTLQSVLQTTYTAIYATENINRGDVVVAVNAGGSTPGGYIAVAKANAATADLSFPVVGISNDNLTTATPLTRLGNAVITGLISGINTQGLTQRRPAYINTVSGGLTSTKPSQPNYVFQVGYCIDQSGSGPPYNGTFWVSPQSVIDTKNLKDVTAATPAENDLLIYKSATSLWTSGPLLKIAQTQTAVTLNDTEFVTNLMIANVVYLPIKTNSAITLGTNASPNPIENLTPSDHGRMLWLHNVSTGGPVGARNITLRSNGTTWLEGGVNLVLPANTMAKFMWLNVGGGAGRWVQTDKAITASGT